MDRGVDAFAGAASIGLFAICWADIGRAGAAAAGRHTSVNRERVAQAVVRAVGIGVIALIGRLDVLAAVVVVLSSNAIGAAWFVPRVLRSGVSTRALDDRAFDAFWWRARPGVLSGVATNRLDHVVLAAMAGVGQLGLYAVAVPIAELPRLMGYAFQRVLLSEASETEQLSIVWATSRLSHLASLVIAFAIFPFSGKLIIIIFGIEFAEAEILLRVLVVASVFVTGSGILGMAILAIGDVAWWSFVNSVGGVATVLLLISLAPVLGALGAALASLIAYLLVWILVIHRITQRNMASLSEMLVPRRSDFTAIRASLTR